VKKDKRKAERSERKMIERTEFEGIVCESREQKQKERDDITSHQHTCNMQSIRFQFSKQFISQQSLSSHFSSNHLLHGNLHRRTLSTSTIHAFDRCRSQSKLHCCSNPLTTLRTSTVRYISLSFFERLVEKANELVDSSPRPKFDTSIEPPSFEKHANLNHQVQLPWKVDSRWIESHPDLVQKSAADRLNDPFAHFQSKRTKEIDSIIKRETK
jgi:hypothetical protein